MGFIIEIWGDYACFTRPELKVERVSYDVITPSAARGIIEAIYWKPEIRYVIDEIRVMNEIKFDNIRRNEINRKQSKLGNYIYSTEERAQRASTLLKDVRYIIIAHFELTGKGDDKEATEGKYINIINRRLEKGQCYHTPYLGTREFACHFRLVKKDEKLRDPIDINQNLGIMLYDMEFDSKGSTATPTYFRCEIKHGVIDLRDVEVLK